MTSEGSAHGRFCRAIDTGNVRNAEDAARELGGLALDDALALVYLYAAAGSPKFEPAALRWLARYLEERSPGLRDVAATAAHLADAGPAPG